MFKRLFLFLFLFFCSVTYAEDKPLTLVLDWFINPDHAPILVAEQQAYFEQAGVKVKIIQPADPSDGPKLVAAGKADMAITYQPQLLMQVDQGLPLVRIGSLVDRPLACVVTLSSSGIKNIEDLKSKTVGYSSGGIDSAVLQTMLSGHHLSLNDIKFINVRYDLVQALLSGNIDAFTGGMRNVEPVQLKQMGHTAQVFLPEDHGFPSYDELIFVVHPKSLGDKRLLMFLEGLQAGTIYLKEHPEEAWEAVIAHHPELNNPVNKAIWLASVPYFSKHPQKLDALKYQKFAQFLNEQKVIQKIPELSTYAR